MDVCWHRCGATQTPSQALRHFVTTALTRRAAQHNAGEGKRPPGTPTAKGECCGLRRGTGQGARSTMKTPKTPETPYSVAAPVIDSESSAQAIARAHPRSGKSAVLVSHGMGQQQP